MHSRRNQSGRQPSRFSKSVPTWRFWAPGCRRDRLHDAFDTAIDAACRLSTGLQRKPRPNSLPNSGISANRSRSAASRSPQASAAKARGRNGLYRGPSRCSRLARICCTSSIRPCRARANAVIVATINSAGYLEFNGKQYVYVVDLTSDKVNPQIGAGKATHRVTFKNVKANGTPVAFPAGIALVACVNSSGVPNASRVPEINRQGTDNLDKCSVRSFSGLPGIWFPVWINVTAGSWLMASV